MDSNLENEGSMVILPPTHRIGVERGGKSAPACDFIQTSPQTMRPGACASELTGSGRHGGMK
jgi:hypothetical protein